MTIWTSTIKEGSGPAYKRIADALHEAITSGTLAPGDRLPAHRDLSYQLDVSIGTITRAYNLAARRGDVTAVVGRGTYVKSTNDQASGAPLNLRINLPANVGQGVDIATALAQSSAASFLSYIPFGGAEQDKAAGRAYLTLGGLKDLASELIVTAGGQHALTTALMAATKPGDLILCEPFTFGGFLDLARLSDRRVMAVPADAQGIRAEAFEKLCKQHRPAAAFLMPTAQNPTGTTLPLKRRKSIAKSAIRHGVLLIEDGLYDPFVSDAPPPLVTFAPDQTFYIASLSKTLAPGLRVGYLACPPALRETANDLQHLLGMGPPMAMANIATQLIENGAVARLVKRQVEEIARRHTLARKIFDPARIPQQSAAPHLWLALPDTWTADAFAMAAETAGVVISPASDFSAGPASNHIRLALGAAPDSNTLEKSLTLLANLMDKGPARASRSV